MKKLLSVFIFATCFTTYAEARVFNLKGLWKGNCTYMGEQTRRAQVVVQENSAEGFVADGIAYSIHSPTVRVKEGQIAGRPARLTVTTTIELSPRRTGYLFENNSELEWLDNNTFQYTYNEGYFGLGENGALLYRSYKQNEDGSRGPLQISCKYIPFR